MNVTEKKRVAVVDGDPIFLEHNSTLLALEGNSHVATASNLAFKQNLFAWEGAPFNVTLSVGIAEADKYSEMEAAISAAGAALYEAKHAGRDQVVLAKARE